MHPYRYVTKLPLLRKVIDNLLNEFFRTETQLFIDKVFSKKFLKRKVMNKVCYKIEILYDKFSPFVIGSLILADNIATYLGFSIKAEGYLFMPSLLTSFHMHISRSNFLLCRFHRVVVNYCILNSIYFAIKEMTDTEGDVVWLAIDSLTTLIVIGIAIYYYRKDKVQC